MVSASTAAQSSVAYLFDPLGNRKQKTVGSLVTQFVDAAGQEFADYDGAGHALFDTVRGPGDEVVATVVASGPTRTYLHLDALGSVVATSQDSVAGGTSYAYGLFGETAAGAGPAFRFTGQRYDAETGLYHLHARAYSPTLGRFEQPDPIGYAGGNNLYAYAAGRGR